MATKKRARNSDGSSNAAVGKPASKAAAKKPKGRLSRGAFALESGKTTLENTAYPGFEMIETEGRGDFTFEGKPYASIVQDGDEVIVSFLMPVTHRGEMAKKAGYEEDPHREGWYRIRLSRAAGPWLEAEVGDRVGETLFALRMRKMVLG